MKVQAPHGPVLTTQLFSPGQPGNQADAIFDPKLLMNIRSAHGGQIATFTFVVNAQ